MSTTQIVKTSELRNPDGLGKEHLHALVRYLGRLAEVDAPTAARAVRYVIDGDDEGVLLTLGGMTDAAAALLLGPKGQTVNYSLLQNAKKERALLWRPGDAAPPVAEYGKITGEDIKALHRRPEDAAPPRVCMRLAQVFDVALRGRAAPVQGPPGWPSWLATFFWDAIAAWHAGHRGAKEWSPWDLAELETMLEAAGVPADSLAHVFLDQPSKQLFQGGGHYYYYANQLAPFSGWQRFLHSHLSVVRDAFAPTEAEHRCRVLRFLSEVRFDCTPLIDLLVRLGVGTAKTVREAALPLLAACRGEARPLVEKALADGDASERHESALLLWRLWGRDAVTTLRNRAAAESSERVKQTIDKLLAAPDESPGDSAHEMAAALPPVEVELGVIDLQEAAKRGLREVVERAWDSAMKLYDQYAQRVAERERPQWQKTPPPRPTPEVLESLYLFVEGKTNNPEVLENRTQRNASVRADDEWLTPPGIHLVHVARISLALGNLGLREHSGAYHVWWRYPHDLESYRRRCKEPFGLRELDAVVASLPGGRPGLVAAAYLNNSRYRSFCDWEPNAVWPLFAEHPKLLHEALNPPASGARDYSRPQKRENAFKVLAMFPRLPAGFIPLLWDLALGEGKTERPLAQAALASLPDKAPKILVALHDGKQTIRAAAAEWLGKIGDPSAIEPLKEAVRTEKQEVVKGAMMAALEALGADVAEFLDRDALRAEAEAGLAKKRPRGIEWVPLDSLPALHWEDTGKPVEPAVVRWWLVQGVQQKSPVCGPLLRRYLGACRKREAAALAKFVLSAWIGCDTRVPSHEEASAMAAKEADRRWASYSTRQYWIDHYKGDKNNLYRELYQKFSTEFVGSAVEQKGMLAVVAAAGDGDCVKLCEQYIRKWFGNRLAQCRALVEVLAWIQHPLAIQVLLSLANRFRTRAVRKAAEEHVRALADREGWTIDELADRTIPDAGFERPVDDAGAPVGDEAALVLDYGPRKFTVQLDDNLQPVIATEEGKTVKNPPPAGKQDDADKAKAARKAFTGAKKTVKEVVKRQTERLYEALCTQRTWRFADWRRYLAGHPIVGRLCVRLAWAAVAPDGEHGGERFLGCFRPLEDGSLTNEKDEEVKWDDAVRVRLAHAGATPAEVGAAWLRHFEDYDVEPLFPQFGRETYALPEEKRKETEITDFEGWQVTTFRLRGKATKLGYVRGEAEDGGWFHVYRKPFPSLGMQAVLEFTGNSLPEEDRPAALQALYFTSVQGDKESVYSWNPSKLPLAKAPPVLLSECYNDIKQLAAEGTGYDPKWREKSYY